jgi:trans-aconitate 2-methyltransferase
MTMTWNPTEYAQNSDAQQGWATELLHEVKLQGSEAILDVGCGDGKITADFAKTLPDSRVVGIDNSAEMIEYANRTYPQTTYPNLSFEKIDARLLLGQAKLSLNFQKEFDLCFSNAALHWVDDHQAFLHGASQVLRSGGRLVVSCGGQGNAAEVLRVFAELMVLDEWQQYFHDFNNTYSFYSDKDYAVWLAEAKFKIEQLKLAPKDMTHKGRTGLGNWIRTTWMPFTHCVPIEQREDFIEHFVDKYLEVHPLDQWGYAHVATVRLEANLVKY